MKKTNVCFSAFVVLLIFGINTETGFLLADGDLYASKCAKCHSLRNPGNYSNSEWKYNVERMAQRAGLSPQEVQVIISLNKKK